MIKELDELKQFVNDNKQCIEEFFGIERQAVAKEDSLGRDSDESEQDFGRDHLEDLMKEQKEDEFRKAEKLRQDLHNFSENLFDAMNQAGD